jgi:hypothetical protein
MENGYVNKNLTRTIVNLLTHNFELRDDWLSTIRMIHNEEMRIHKIPEENYYNSVFFTDKLSNTYTIKRIWGMVQENRPDLRGKCWEERQRQGGIISREIVFFDVKQLKMFDE